MKIKDFNLGDKTLRLSVFSDNIIRFRISDNFEPTLFEKYSIYNKPDEDGGEVLENGLKAGDLSVTYENGTITISSSKFTRKITFNYTDTKEKADYFDKKLDGFRPERKKIVGDISEDEKIEYVDFVTDPKYITLQTEGEIFYGLGEGNIDRTTLNGKTYLERVIYVKEEIPVPYIMTKSGYGILCNSTMWHGIDIGDNNPNEVCWFLPATDLDFYVFAGNTLKALLERFTYCTGRTMVLPKWGYGLTFIDQYNADQFEVMRNAAQFREKKIPCDTFSLEPGWMSKNYDFSTEKKWNTQRFYICDWMRNTGEEFTAHSPREKAFTTTLGRYGFKLMLWLCCKYDFTANEENRAGNPTDFGFENWFKHLKGFVLDGAAGFKMDPCKLVDTATETRVYANGRGEPEMHSLQTTLYGKEMYQGFSEFTNLRPMHHMSGGYTSMNRYSACTTGDSGGGHKPFMWIINSGMSAVSNITCDMDIFKKHTIHFCFFTAWCQLNSWSGYSHPWWAGDDLEAIFTYYDRLRYRILPYIYSNAINAHLTGTPVVRAMALEFDDKECVDSKNEYMFGDYFLVAAFDNKVYLPGNNTWINYWTGEVIKSKDGKEIDVEVPEDRGGPLFVKGGAIIPTQKEKQFTDCVDDEHLTLEVYPINDISSEFTLYEDDGKTLEYLNGKRSSTKFTMETTNNICNFTIGSREGEFNGMNPNRTYSINMFAQLKPSKVLVDGVETSFEYDGRFAKFDAKNGKNVVVVL